MIARRVISRWVLAVLSGLAMLWSCGSSGEEPSGTSQSPESTGQPSDAARTDGSRVGVQREAEDGADREDVPRGSEHEASASDGSVVPPGEENYVEQGTTASNAVAPLECPTSVPLERDTCEIERISCTYGDSTLPECRTRATCRSGQWVLAFDGECEALPDDYCPAEAPEGPCNPVLPDVLGEGVVEFSACGYGESTICLCKCFGASCLELTPNWECIGPPDDERCPGAIPNVGERCDEDGLACDYGDPCTSGAGRICRYGVWFKRGREC